jgi:hypothetical protein
MRLISAEFLKLRKRTGLVLAAFGLTIVPGIIMLAVTGGGDADTGGLRTFADEVGIVAMLSIVASILVGATLGTSDVSTGVFRDLVVTGRSRLQLFAARAPAGLALVLAVGAAGYLLAVLTAQLSAGTIETGLDRLGTIAPSTGLLLETAAWLALACASSFALALGVSSLFGSIGGSIATLLALWMVVTPLVQGLDALHWLSDALVISGLDRLMPDGLRAHEENLLPSLTGAIVVIAAWAAVPLGAGAWRTMTRDA